MVNVRRLRYWFGAATVLILVVVAGFYLFARYRFFHAVKEVPQNLGIDIQQSTESFSLSKSEGGRTLFTIRASKAVQYKQGGRAVLHNVSIVVYGHESNRFDQIYGDDFEYDPQTGNVVAKGVVHIDLEANPVPDAHPELGLPKELKNPIHLTTSGIVFNQKSGIARTDNEISFEIPQANGSAKGVYYDSNSNVLTLGSNIVVQTSGPQATKIRAQHGTIRKDPRGAVLENVTVDRRDDVMAAQKATLFLRDDNTLERILAQGDVQTSTKGETGLVTHAPEAEFLMTRNNQIKSVAMNGSVMFQTTGSNQIDGKAGRVIAVFGPEAKIKVVHCVDGVRILQKPSGMSATSATNLVKAKAGTNNTAANAQKDQIELTAQALDLVVKGGRVLDRAETVGPAQLTIVPQPSPGRVAGPTVVTAGQFTALMKDNRLAGVHGAPQARIIQSMPGQSDKVSTSDNVDALFDKTGRISGFVQQGNFQYTEGKLGETISRSASADKATYSNATQILMLEGSPRVVDGGMATTAQVIRLNRASGDGEAQNNVKTTYNELAPQPNGALLASSEPVHVTGAKMTFARSSGVARYTGGARLWQGANIVEAPSIIFDRDSRSMDAQGSSGKRVSVVLVQQGKNSKLIPVNVSAVKLVYTDQQRQARFEGDVQVRSSEGSMSADRVTVYLKPHSASHASKAQAQMATPSELDRIAADGHVVLQQPNRRGTGDKLVYTADDGRFVMTGGPPTIFDAQQGTVTGSSLTFYSRDDRVLVEGGSSTRAVTTTRVSK